MRHLLACLSIRQAEVHSRSQNALVAFSNRFFDVPHVLWVVNVVCIEAIPDISLGNKAEKEKG